TPILAITGLALMGPAGGEAAAAADPAARGLDVFLDRPTRGAPGAALPLQIQAFGFPTAVTLAPLAGAEIEASWDPESLAAGSSKAPPAVNTTTDAAGRAHLEVPVPAGDERTLTLLIGTRFGEHRRTTELQIERLAARELDLIVPDNRVVPGGATSAWVIAR